MSEREVRGAAAEQREVDAERIAGDAMSTPTLRDVLTELREIRAEIATMRADLGSRLDGLCAEIRAILEEFAAELRADLAARLDGVGAQAEQARAALHIVEHDEE